MLPTKPSVCCCTYTAVLQFVAQSWHTTYGGECHTRMMMLPAVAYAAGHGCSVVCVICMFTAVVHRWLGVRSRGGETQVHYRKYGDAAHNSSKSRINIRSRPRKKQLTTAVRCRWMCHTRTVLPTGSAAGRQYFNVVVALCELAASWLCSWLCSCEGQKQVEC